MHAVPGQPQGGRGKLLAVSDLHVGYPENRRIVEDLWPATGADWLLVAGDVAEQVADVEWALGVLSERFAQVVWTPGNHELWTVAADPVQLRGLERYEHLVAVCRELGVVTPEDPYPTWTGTGGPAVVAPLFVLYDYSFLPAGTGGKAEALELAYAAGVVCTDEFLLHPDPYPSREAWCEHRVAITESRLEALPPGVPAVLVSHYPLVREPTDILRHPEFALWCGTERTRDWHRRFDVAAVVYGHLHVPRVTWSDGVRFEEVSLGYPAERQRREESARQPASIPGLVRPGAVLRQILPRPERGPGQVPGQPPSS